jgi:hypothetical protein
MNIESAIRKLAKSNKYQNLFLACKDLKEFRLFKNRRDLSNIQDLFLNYLYAYETLHQDLTMKKVSKHLFDCELFEDCYLLWKREGDKNKDTSTSTGNVKLVPGNDIIFPSSEAK